MEDAIARLLANLAAAHETPPDHFDELRQRLKRAAVLLQAAGAISDAPARRIRLTDLGSRLLASHPDGVDQSVLSELPEFRAWITAESATEPIADPRLSAFTAGMRGFAEGLKISDNPHPFDHPDHLAWECGWSEARDR
jgi:restriction system protein